MSRGQAVLVGQVFRCSNCGAEVAVVRAGGERPTPRCCNRPMVLQEQLVTIFYCVNCGAEVVVIRKGACLPTPRCCNRPMLVRSALAA